MLIKEKEREREREEEKEEKQIKFIDFSDLDDEYIINNKVYEVSLEDSTELYTELRYYLYIDDVRKIDKDEPKHTILKPGLYYEHDSITYELSHICRVGDYLVITFNAKNIKIIY